MLNLSEVSTPDGLSLYADNNYDLSDNDGIVIERKSEEDAEDREDRDERRRQKPHSKYVVRTKIAPQYGPAKNRFDTYLTKTSMRAISFSENKQRWQRIINNDLYSKTKNRGIP